MYWTAPKYVNNLTFLTLVDASLQNMFMSMQDFAASTTKHVDCNVPVDQVEFLPFICGTALPARFYMFSNMITVGFHVGRQKLNLNH